MTHNHTIIKNQVDWNPEQGEYVISNPNYVVPSCPACEAI